MNINFILTGNGRFLTLQQTIIKKTSGQWRIFVTGLELSSRMKAELNLHLNLFIHSISFFSSKEKK